jgi:two-component system CheB/CheR fusion protein
MAKKIEKFQIKKIIGDPFEYAESILGTIRESSLVLDADLRVISANKYFYQIFKVKPKETEGCLIYNLGNGQWDIPELKKLLEDIIPKKNIFNDYEIKHDFKTIGPKTMLLNARRLSDRIAKIPLIFLAIEDITERRRLEKVEQQKLEYLVELDKIKDDFLSVTTHELRAPLVPIKAQAQMLLAGDYGDLNPGQKRAVEMIFRNEEDLFKLSHDLMDIIKIKSNKLVLFLEECQIEKIIQEAVANTKNIAEEKHVTLSLASFPELPKMILDKRRIGQVLTNLIYNAIVFTPEKGGVNVKIQKSKDAIVVIVKDSGVGISPENLKQLFTPFFQVGTVLNRKYVGSGLGLALSKGIIEAHGGKIWVESKGEGQGSTFSFSLPLKEIIKNN